MSLRKMNRSLIRCSKNQKLIPMETKVILRLIKKPSKVTKVAKGAMMMTINRILKKIDSKIDLQIETWEMMTRKVSK
tara:strand:+ start:168 stop:398 length:231 start_codon:yes stop_codon:yes gene_type:complete